MHVTACLAGQKEDVEVGENCRTIQALKEAIVEALPTLCVEGFDVSVGGRALDDEGAVSLEESTCLDVVPNRHAPSVLALREAGHKVGEEGLLRAVQAGDVELCTLYLDAGVPPNCGSSGMTPLHLTLQLNKLRLFKVFLDRQPDGDVQCPGSKGMTLLHSAVVFNRPAFCELLLDRGHPVQCVNEEGKTPLHFAAKRRSPTIAKILLERQHEVQCADYEGVTPLHAAAEDANVALCELLLDHQHELQCVDGEGRTPLHSVCWVSCPETCQFLLDRGHDVHVVDAEGKTPLDWAKEVGNEDLCKVMRDHQTSS